MLNKMFPKTETFVPLDYQWDDRYECRKAANEVVRVIPTFISGPFSTTFPPVSPGTRSVSMMAREDEP